MSERDTFGPRLRRERERRGISLDTLATRTNVSIELWIGLESNDFSKWPGGLFARAFVRDYATVIGLDAQELVDDFCRLFPVGDRRALPRLRAQAELIGHELQAADDPKLIPGGVDRRAGAAGPGAVPAQPAGPERPAARRWWWPKKASVP
jgi:transcriptional regulator with XRE-family HTH domain